MTYKEIQELNAVEPFCFEDNTQEQWYKCGLVEGADVAYKQAAKDIKEWIDNNLSGYITNDGDWADIEHMFKEEFGS